MQLTDVQAAIVEKNHMLIYAFLKTHGLNADDPNDWYGAAAIGLCKAAMRFDESRGCEFSTLAYICMQNEIRMEMRKLNRQLQPSESLEMECYTHGGEECGTLADHICDQEDFRESISIQTAIDKTLNSLSTRDREIIELYCFKNHKQESIAKDYNLSRAYVSRIVCAFKNKLKKALSS